MAELIPAASDRLLTAGLCALLFAVACIGAGFGARSSTASSASPCSAERTAESNEITVPSGNAAQPLALKGVLRHDADAVRYSFRAAAGMRLEWAYSGPPVHVVLTYPNCDSDGPFTSSTLDLPDTGLYVLGLHSNTMADDADGPFTLRLRLLP